MYTIPFDNRQPLPVALRSRLQSFSEGWDDPMPEPYWSLLAPAQSGANRYRLLGDLVRGTLAPSTSVPRVLGREINKQGSVAVVCCGLNPHAVRQALGKQLADLPSGGLARLHFVVPDGLFLFTQLNRYPLPEKPWLRVVARLRSIDDLALVAIDRLSGAIENMPQLCDDDFAYHLRKRLHITQGQLRCPVVAFT